MRSFFKAAFVLFSLALTAPGVVLACDGGTGRQASQEKRCEGSAEACKKAKAQAEAQAQAEDEGLVSRAEIVSNRVINNPRLN